VFVPNNPDNILLFAPWRCFFALDDVAGREAEEGVGVVGSW
jgi:hypothetical protein